MMLLSIPEQLKLLGKHLSPTYVHSYKCIIGTLIWIRCEENQNTFNATDDSLNLLLLILQLETPNLVSECQNTVEIVIFLSLTL